MGGGGGSYPPKKKVESNRSWKRCIFFPFSPHSFEAVNSLFLYPKINQYLRKILDTLFFISNLLVVACHRVQKLSSVDASDQEIWTDESETIHGEDPLANEYDGQKVDAEVVPKDIPLHERGVDAAFGEGDKNSNNPLESSSQSKSKKKKKKKKKKKEQNASEETGSQTIDQSVNKDEEEKADDISLHEGIASNQIATSIPFFPSSA